MRRQTRSVLTALVVLIFFVVVALVLLLERFAPVWLCDLTLFVLGFATPGGLALTHLHLSQRSNDLDPVTNV
jgi:hypothetical protein